MQISILKLSVGSAVRLTISNKGIAIIRQDKRANRLRHVCAFKLVIVLRARDTSYKVVRAVSLHAWFSSATTQLSKCQISGSETMPFFLQLLQGIPFASRPLPNRMVRFHTYVHTGKTRKRNTYTLFLPTYIITQFDAIYKHNNVKSWCF